MHYLRHEHLNALRAVPDPVAAEAVDFILENWVPRRESDQARVARLRARVKKLKAACEGYEAEVAALRKRIRDLPKAHIEAAVGALDRAKAALKIALGGNDDRT
jgi:hypothetical protein